MINFITIINIDTPTWPLPTNTNNSKFIWYAGADPGFQVRGRT